MADLNAKESTQETLMTVCGMVFGLMLASRLQRIEEEETYKYPPGTSFCLEWTIFLVLTAIHIWANYRGVQVLKLTTLNLNRTRLAFRRIAKQHAAATLHKKVSLGVLTKNSIAAADTDYDWSSLILAPEEVNESLWASVRQLCGRGAFVLGVPLEQLFERMDCQDAFRHTVFPMMCQGNCNYLLGVNAVKGKIYVALRRYRDHSNRDRAAATTQQVQVDELQSVFHACLLEECLRSSIGRAEEGEGEQPKKKKWSEMEDLVPILER
jgi:hypothetical protein